MPVEETDEMMIRPCLYEQSLDICRDLEAKGGRVVSVVPTAFLSKKTEEGNVVLQITRVGIYWRDESGRVPDPVDEDQDPFAGWEDRAQPSPTK